MAVSTCPQGIHRLLTGDEHRGSSTPVWACRAQRGEGAPATGGTRRLCRPTRPRSAAERPSEARVRRTRVARFPYALFGFRLLFHVRSVSGGLERWYIRGTRWYVPVRTPCHLARSACTVRCCFPGHGPLEVCALIGARGTAVRMPERGVARHERRSLLSSVRVVLFGTSWLPVASRRSRCRSHATQWFRPSAAAVDNAGIDLSLRRAAALSSSCAGICYDLSRRPL